MDSRVSSEYLAFLLRLWKVRNEGECWRASIERVDSGEKHGFTNLEELIAFLRHSTEPGPPEEPGKADEIGGL